MSEVMMSDDYELDLRCQVCGEEPSLICPTWKHSDGVIRHKDLDVCHMAIVDRLEAERSEWAARAATAERRIEAVRKCWKDDYWRAAWSEDFAREAERLQQERNGWKARAIEAREWNELLQNDRDEWKARAEEAEAELTAIKATLDKYNLVFDGKIISRRHWYIKPEDNQ